MVRSRCSVLRGLQAGEGLSPWKTRGHRFVVVVGGGFVVVVGVTGFVVVIVIVGFVVVIVVVGFAVVIVVVGFAVIRETSTSFTRRWQMLSPSPWKNTSVALPPRSVSQVRLSKTVAGLREYEPFRPPFLPVR